MVLDTASQQEEEDGERDEEGLQAAVDAQGLDEEAEGQDAPQRKHHLVRTHYVVALHWLVAGLTGPYIGLQHRTNCVSALPQHSSCH